MTASEAMKMLKNAYLGDSELMKQAKFTAVEALEKQIPKRVVLQPFEEEDISTILSLCPVCGDIVKVEYNKCCGNCGQKLDWSVEF